MRDEVVDGEGVLDQGADLGQGEGLLAAPAALNLEEGVGHRGEYDVPLSAGQRAALEVIEAEFVFAFLVFLLDGPALMGEADERPAATPWPAGRRDLLGARARAERAFAEQPHLRREPAVPPVMGRRHADRTETRPPRRLCAGAPRDDALGLRRLLRRPRAGVDRRHARGQLRPGAGTSTAARHARRGDRGCAQEDRQRGGHAQGIRQPGAMQGASERGVLARLRVPQDRRHRDSGTAHLRSSVSASRAFVWKRTARGLRARPRRRAVSHTSGRYSAAPSSHARVPVHNATVTAVWQFASLPSAPQYWRPTPTEAAPCLGKLEPSRMSTPLRSGTTARTTSHTRSESHAASVMKCRSA